MIHTSEVREVRVASGGGGGGAPGGGGPSTPPGAFGSAIAGSAPAAPPGPSGSTRIASGSTGSASGSAEQAVDAGVNALKNRVTDAVTNLYFPDRLTDTQKKEMQNDDEAFEEGRQASLWSATGRCRELWWQEREALKKAKTNMSANKARHQALHVCLLEERMRF